MPEQMTKQGFIDKVFDFENEKEWAFKGDKPAIIDFYADWCGPCKMVAPIMDELATEFDGRLDVYKVDTDKEQELAMAFGVQSIPSILFIPTDDKPQMATGALPKPTMLEVMKDVLKLEA